MNALRHAYGLRWQADRLQARDLSGWLPNAAIIGGLLAAYAIVGAIDHAADMATRAAIAERIAKARTEQLAACLNGTLRLAAPDGSGAAVCMEAATWISQ